MCCHLRMVNLGTRITETMGKSLSFYFAFSCKVESEMAIGKFVGIVMNYILHVDNSIYQLHMVLLRVCVYNRDVEGIANCSLVFCTPKEYESIL